MLAGNGQMYRTFVALKVYLQWRWRGVREEGMTEPYDWYMKRGMRRRMNNLHALLTLIVVGGLAFAVSCLFRFFELAM